jgi:hypothetical protein
MTDILNIVRTFPETAPPDLVRTWEKKYGKRVSNETLEQIIEENNLIIRRRRFAQVALLFRQNGGA